MEGNGIWVYYISLLDANQNELGIDYLIEFSGLWKHIQTSRAVKNQQYLL